MLNNHVNCEFINLKKKTKKTKICIIWCNLHAIHHYVYTNETNIFKFWPMYLKSSINVLLVTKYQNIYQHIWKYFPSSKFKIQNKLSNGN